MLSMTVGWGLGLDHGASGVRSEGLLDRPEDACSCVLLRTPEEQEYDLGISIVVVTWTMAHLMEMPQKLCTIFLYR